MCPSGYWGESGRNIAKRISQHYQGRFGNDIKKRPETQDIAVLLEGIREGYQIRFLAELITKRTIKEGESYREKAIDTIHKLRSLQQGEELKRSPINPRTIEYIFSNIGFEF